MTAPSSDEPVSVLLPAAAPTGARVPAPPQRVPPTWVPPGQAVTLGGFRIEGGMLYVQSGLPDPANRQHGVIEEDLPVSEYDVPYRRDVQRIGGFWQLHPDQRREFLKWLANGRRDVAPVGFAYMVLFGLERRVLVDTREAQTKAAAFEDLPRIRELCMQLMFEFSRDTSFKAAAAALLDFISLLAARGALLRAVPVPFFPPTASLPCYLRLAIGQSSRDHVPLSASLALAWVLASTNLFHQTAVSRCPLQFRRLFEHRYREKFGPGVELPRGGKGRVKLDYQPSSPSLAGKGSKQAFEDVPDIASSPGVVGQLTRLAKSAATELESYSRKVGRKGARPLDADTVLLLPPHAWEPEALSRVQALHEVAGAGPVAMQLQELLALFAQPYALDREGYAALGTALRQMGLGIEPALDRTVAKPQLSATVVLYRSVDAKPAARGKDPHFEGAALLVELAGLVSAADAPINEVELRFIVVHISQWKTLAAASLPRLAAMAQAAGNTPVALRSLSDRIGRLSPATRAGLGDFLVQVAAVDGVVSAAEAKTLEKVFAALALDVRQLDERLRAVGFGFKAQAAPAPAHPAAVRQRVHLDLERIARVQQDARAADALLAHIFVEEDAAHAQAAQFAHPEALLPGLDFAHSQFVQALSAREQWPRSDLVALAAGHGLMLDGALEVINDAAFDAFDQAFTEGEDPVNVSRELLSNISS